LWIHAVDGSRDNFVAQVAVKLDRLEREREEFLKRLEAIEVLAANLVRSSEDAFARLAADQIRRVEAQANRIELQVDDAVFAAHVSQQAASDLLERVTNIERRFGAPIEELHEHVARRLDHFKESLDNTSEIAKGAASFVRGEGARLELEKQKIADRRKVLWWIVGLFAVAVISTYAGKG
jgi:phage shock protein A